MKVSAGGRIAAGDLRHRVDVFAVGTNVDSSGFPVPGEVPAGRRSVNIEPLSGDELTFASQVHGGVTHRITMRRMNGLTTRHFMKFGDRRFDIVSLRLVDEIGEMMEVIAREKV